MRFIKIMILLALIALPVLAQDADESTTFTTYHGLDGNRYIDGSGSFPDVGAAQIELDGDAIPVWLVGAYDGDVLRWLYQTANGQTGHIDVDFGGQTVNVTTGDVYAGILAGTRDDAGDFGVVPLPEDASAQSHPILTGEQTIYVADKGDVVIRNVDGEIARQSLAALPDARIVIERETNRAAVYVSATDERYVHNVLGDALEAAALVVLDLDDLSIQARIDLEGSDVFEGISPLWADVDEDGSIDLVTTVSNGRDGAGVRVYSADDGSLMAQGPVIGQGNRWRHQLAWGPFGLNGENELIDVLTPHIGGVAEFYRFADDQLAIIAQTPGYTSHIIGTRNLDMALAGDFNGDGQPELAIPTQDRRAIVGLQRSDASIVGEVWRLALDSGRVVSNLAAVSLADDGLALAAGLDTGQVQIWVP